MNIGRFLIVFASALFCVNAVSIDHDKVQPLAQPEPATVSEKAALKFKPRLLVNAGCLSFPAVNAAGETSGGLKGNSGSEGCESAPLGSQVYDRATWHKDVWAIMYAWYFPKGLWDGHTYWSDDWGSAVVWIDNPAVDSPKIMGLSMSNSDINAWDSITTFVKELSVSFANGTTHSFSRAPGAHQDKAPAQR